MSARCDLRSTLILSVILLSQGCVSVTTSSLLDEMADLNRLAELPCPAYTTRQASSYDRKSTSPDDVGNWFANADYGQFIREESVGGRKELVMMDADGPGAIVRIWSANPKGTLRIYLDGSDEPAIEALMTDLLGGKTEGFPKPLAGERARGWNLYFPIPYARHCKVTSDEGGFYYHVNYRTYEPGTRVASFAAADLSRLHAQIGRVASELTFPIRAAASSPDAKTIPWQTSLAPGASAELASLDGMRTISAFCCMKVKAGDILAGLRSVVLTTTFDGEKTVECPLGDFFGTAPGLNRYESLAMGITDGAPPMLWSHWRMPFQRSARIEVRNLGDQPVELAGRLVVEPYRWTERSLLFHAKWRIEQDLPSRPFSDWTHLECQGTGRFVGGALHVINPVREWWGEGDEKIYVDGESFPSHFGTGTEDYYGYAWCSNLRFVHAYHNQPRCDGPANYGHTSVNRLHIIDDIPFKSRFKFDIENWHSRETRTTRAAVSYWYARPGGSDFFKPITPADVIRPVAPPRKIFKADGAIEGENLTVVSKDGGNIAKQEMLEQWSEGAQLWWTWAKPGQKLVLAFEVPEGGAKHVFLRLTQAPDYGQFRVWVNDQPVDRVIDLFHGDVRAVAEMDLGRFDLKKGRNLLTVEIVGANEKAEKAYMFGLDYLKVK